MHCIHGTQGVQTLVLFFFRLRMPSASSPALSRVVSPNARTCCVVARGEGGMGGGGGALGVTG